MIQLGRILDGWVGDIPTTFIHLAGAGSKISMFRQHADYAASFSQLCVLDNGCLYGQIVWLYVLCCLIVFVVLSDCMCCVVWFSPWHQLTQFSPKLINCHPVLVKGVKHDICVSWLDEIFFNNHSTLNISFRTKTNVRGFQWTSLD